MNECVKTGAVVSDGSLRTGLVGDLKFDGLEWALTGSPRGWRVGPTDAVVSGLSPVRERGEYTDYRFDRIVSVSEDFAAHIDRWYPELRGLLLLPRHAETPDD
jgi:hypothetical protein